MDKFDPKENLISLKQASEISGYSPDYIGQLIRSGKLYGKQVYCNVAWMTTEEDIKKYVGKKSAKPENNPGFTQRSRHFIDNAIAFGGLQKWGLRMIVFFCAVVALFLFYIFSIGLEKKLEENARQKAQMIESGQTLQSAF